jgi:hypothetical protein
MSARALKTIRARTERWLVDDVEFWRPSSTEFDDDTLREELVEGQQVWEGKGRVRPTSGPREAAIAEGVIALRDADILIPVGAFIPRRDDEVYVSSSQNPKVAGRWFRVTDVRAASQEAATRCSAIQAQPSERWHP